jgi:hypothetical protein
MPTWSYSSSSSSYSSNLNGQRSGHSHQEISHTTPEGTTVRTTTQNLGERPITETRRFDTQGQELIGDNAGNNTSKRIQDVSHEEEADHAYEERIEDEYAKREGGA